MNRMVCEDCATVYFSAAAKTLSEQGQVCAKCGGRLVLDEGRGPVRVSGDRPAPAEDGDD